VDLTVSENKQIFSTA